MTTYEWILKKRTKNKIASLSELDDAPNSQGGVLKAKDSKPL